MLRLAIFKKTPSASGPPTQLYGVVFCELVHLAFCLLLHLLHSISMSGTDKPGAYLDTSLCACQTTSLLGKLFAEIMHSQD